VSVTLNNKRILVTRPEHQAEHLCELISNIGGDSILFPTIEIKFILDSKNLLNCFSHINKYDFVIFVSRNAVAAVVDNYLSQTDLSLAQIQLLAIGAGTAAAMAEMNMTEVLHAGIQADSESLLKLPALQGELVEDKKILIVRGVGGRELLAEGLKARAALVDYAEVYERRLPEYKAQERLEIWQGLKPEAIIVSSNQGFNNLLKLTLEENQQQLFNTPLVVMSARTADLAKDQGFVQGIAVAKNKNDQGLVSALLELVGD